MIILEEFRRAPEVGLTNLAAFLGVKYEPGSVDTQVYNAFGEPRGPWTKFIHRNKRLVKVAEKFVPPKFGNWIRWTFLLRPAKRPEMDPKAEKLLVALYREDVRRVRELLSRDLPWTRYLQT